MHSAPIVSLSALLGALHCTVCVCVCVCVCAIQVTRAHFEELRGLRVQRMPFAYCILGVQGNCRYPEHLSIASGLVPWLVELQPWLCGRLGERQHCSAGASAAASGENPTAGREDPIPIPQTLEAERIDFRFCALITRCRNSMVNASRRVASTPAFSPLGRGCCRAAEGTSLLPWGSSPSPTSIAGRSASDSMNSSMCSALCAADSRCDAYELNVSAARTRQRRRLCPLNARETIERDEELKAQPAPCSLLPAVCSAQPALRSLLHAACPLHLAPCSLHPAACTLLSP